MSKIVRSNNKKIYMFFMISVLFFSVMNISTIADDPLLPDLKPHSLTVPDQWEEGEEIEMIFKVKNVGTKNVTEGETINVEYAEAFEVVRLIEW